MPTEMIGHRLYWHSQLIGFRCLVENICDLHKD